MKLLRTIGLAAFLAAFLAGIALAAQPAVGLGTAKSFAVLAGSTITNTGPTTITGNVGVQPGKAVTGFNSVTLHGTLHKADAVALQAKNALITAYNDAAGRNPATAVPVELGGTTLKAGVYASATLGLTGTLKLDAEGNPNAVFIFQAGSTLITASGSKVELINGASPCNVYWQVGSSATLAKTTSFEGTILALTSITLVTGAKLDGRALARNGAVTLNNNVITNAACSTPTSSASPRASAAGAIVTPPATNTNALSQQSGSGTILPLALLLLLLAATVTVGFATTLRGAIGRRRR